jgi:hypothetical protein
LYYHEKNEWLPTNCLVTSEPDTDLPDRGIMALLSAQMPTTIGNGVFSYRSLVAEDEKYASAWLLVFYEAVPIVGWTMPPARTT